MLEVITCGVISINVEGFLGNTKPNSVYLGRECGLNLQGGNIFVLFFRSNICRLARHRE